MLSFSMQWIKSPSVIYAFRSAWQIRYRLLAMILIAAFSFAIYVGTFSAISSLLTSCNYWYTKGNLADLELRFAADDIDNLPDFSNLNFVKSLQERMVFPGTVELNKENILSILLITSMTKNNNAINSLQLLNGKLLDKNDKKGVLIERSFAKYHNIKIGSKLTVKLGKEAFELHVIGIVTSPEFLLAPASSSLFVPTKGSLGVIYANPELLDDTYGFNIVDSILFKFKPGTDLNYAREIIYNLAKTRLNVDWTTSKKEQFAYQFLNKDLSVFKTIMPVIAFISILSSIVVTIFLFFQWISEERQHISVLMTLGYKVHRICCSFLLVILLLVIITIGLGVFFSFGVLTAFANNFAGSIGLPEPILKLDVIYIVRGIIILLCIFSIAGLFAIKKILAMTPKEVIISKLPDSFIGLKKTNSILLAKIKFVWLRFAVRNVLRTARISMMTIIAVALGFGITASFFITFSSFIGTSIHNVERDRWNLVVDFSAPVWQEDLLKYTKLSGVNKIVPFTKSVIQANYNGKYHNLYVGGIDPTHPMRILTVLAGRLLQASDYNSIILEKSVAAELGLSLGQSFTIESLGQKYSVVLEGIFSGALPGEAYLPISFHRHIADLTERSTGLFVTTNNDEHKVTREFYYYTDVQKVLNKQKVINDILQASGQITQIISMGSMISIMVALLFIFASVSYTIMQRKQEYILLRVLGYKMRTIAFIILAEIILLGFAALLVAIPIGYLIAEYLNYKISELWFHIDTALTIKDYMIILIPGFLSMPIAAIPIIIALQREPLQSSIKVRWVI